MSEMIERKQRCLKMLDEMADRLSDAAEECAPPTTRYLAMEMSTAVHLVLVALGYDEENPNV